MQIAHLPAAAGRRWVAEGFRLFARQPAPLLSLTLLYLLLVLGSSLIPAVGPALVLLLMPGLMVGAMHTVREIERGTLGGYRGIIEGFRRAALDSGRPLLALGGVNVAAALLAYLVASLITDDAMTQFVITQLLYAPVQMPLWYAPMFVAWHRLPPGKSMFFSIAAVLRNKGAFLQYVAAWAVLALAASLIVQVLLLAFGMAPLLVLLVFLPLSLVMPTAVYCSFWPSYRDVVTGD